MTNYIINKPVNSLLIALILITFCNGQIKPLVQKENNTSKIGQARIPLPKGANKDVRIVASIEDTDGNLWFGSVGEGLYKYDRKLFIHYGMEQGLNSNAIYSILQDNTGNVWVGTNKGLNRFNGNKCVSIPIVLITSHSS
jgi:ligand-binding sensor domain-containing protein